MADQLLCICNFTAEGMRYEAWMRYRIPHIDATEIINAECETLRIISERLKAKKMVFGEEIDFFWHVLMPGTYQIEIVDAMVPPIEDNLRWSLKIHRMEG